jgi:hypothetical protein
LMSTGRRRQALGACRRPGSWAHAELAKTHHSRQDCWKLLVPSAHAVGVARGTGLSIALLV